MGRAQPQVLARARIIMRHGKLQPVRAGGANAVHGELPQGLLGWSATVGYCPGGDTGILSLGNPSHRWDRSVVQL
jgi:hypothetical protein